MDIFLVKEKKLFFMTNIQDKALKFCSIAIQCLFLAIIIIVPSYFAFFHELYSTTVLGKVVIFRILVILAGLLYLVKIFLQGKFAYRFNRYFFGAVIFLAISLAISSIFSANPMFSWWGSYYRQQGFFSLIFYLVFFLVFSLNSESFSQIKRYISCLIFSSFLVCSYGFLQFFSLDPFSWQEPFSQTLRLFSSFGQPNFFGHFLVLTVPFSVYAFFFLTHRLLVRSLLLVIFFAQLLCLIFTISRSSWLAFGAELFVLALAFFWFKLGNKIKKFRLIFLFAGLILAGCFFIGLTAKLSPDNFFITRLSSMANFKDGSVKMRLDIWQEAMAEIKTETLKRKILGYGPDSLSEIFARHYQSSWAADEKVDSWPDRAHNLIFEIILSNGFLGLIAYILFLLAIFKRAPFYFSTAPKDEKFWLAIFCLAALIGYFVNNLFSFSDTPQYLIFYFILGLLAYLFFAAENEKELIIKLRLPFRIFVVIFFFILGAFLIFISLRSIAADHYLMKAKLADRNDCPEILNNDRKAFLLAPGNNSFYIQTYLSDSFYCLDRLADADSRQQLKENMLWVANSLPAEDAFTFLKYQANLAFVLASSSSDLYFKEADKYFKLLEAQYPSINQIYLDRAKMELKKGDYNEVIMVADKGIALLSPHGNGLHQADINGRMVSYYYLIGKAYVAKEEIAKAQEYFLKILSLDPYYIVAYKEIADIYYQKGDLDKALWYNKKGYRLNPSDYNWPLAIGILYLEKGDKIKAVSYFKEVLALDSENTTAKKFISDSEASPNKK